MSENSSELTAESTTSCKSDVQGFRGFILSNEEWLRNRILLYAKRQDYSKYTSTLMEAWRLSISGLSEALLNTIDKELKELELNPDEDYTKDPAAAFGIHEAKLHRKRGVDLGMFLGLMKYYKQTYMDLIDQNGSSIECKDINKKKLERFFDRVELGFCVEWNAVNETEKLTELQDKNREVINEKNRYLSIFETIHAPVVLIDEENNIENYNQAWNELFEESAIPGSIYYNKNISPRKSIPSFISEILPLLENSISDYTLEKRLITKKGVKFFQIKIKKMLDVSDRYHGMVIILNDLTELKKAEQEELHKKKLEGVLELAGAVCHEVNQPLQVIQGQAEFIKISSGEGNPIQKNMDILLKQVANMGKITNRLMNITKYETKSYLHKTIIDLEKSSVKKEEQ